MTSLPLYWPLGAELGAIASGTAPVPWQRRALEQHHALTLLDTLAPIPALVAGEPDTDPLAGLARLAIIQPRGLAPADNVALDQWAMAGGQVLLVLDPQLTGDYDVGLGDPRRPADVALIPPVVARWGLAITFDETQSAAVRLVPLGDGQIPLVLAGAVTISQDAVHRCRLFAAGAGARCRVGKGQVTLLADATVFEASQPTDAARASLASVLAFAFGAE